MDDWSATLMRPKQQSRPLLLELSNSPSCLVLAISLHAPIEVSVARHREY